MKQYKVFKHPAGAIEAVKQGWSWPGFLFDCIWALVKRMWGLGIGVFIGAVILAMIFISIFGEQSGEGLYYLCGFIAKLTFGANGNSWREKNLASRGFEHVDTVSASNPEGAIALYLKEANIGR